MNANANVVEQTETANNELVAFVEQSGVEKETAQTLLERFTPFFEQAEEWKRKAEALRVTDVNQKREMQEARNARLALKEIRINADKTRKALKEDSLRYGKAVQGVYNVIEFLIVPIEEHLEQQEKFAEIQEQKRKAEIKEQRISMLIPYEVQTDFYDLAGMDEQTFETLLNNSKRNYEERIEAARKEEADRIERERIAAEKREEMAKENARLRAEAAEKEKALAEERAKAEAHRRAAEAEAKKAREEFERKAAEAREREIEEQKKLREEAQAKIEVERKERERVEAELKAKKEAEEKARLEAEAAAEAELAKGDSAKIDDLIKDLESLQTKYSFRSKKNKATYSEVNVLLNKIISHITAKSK